MTRPTKTTTHTGRFVRFTFRRGEQTVAVVTSSVSVTEAFLTGPSLPRPGELLELRLSLGADEEVRVRARVTEVAAESSGALSNPGFTATWLEARTLGQPKNLKEFLAILPGDPGGRLVTEAERDGRVSFRYEFPAGAAEPQSPDPAPDLASLAAIAPPPPPASGDDDEDTDPEAADPPPEADEEDEDTPADASPEPAAELAVLGDFDAEPEDTAPELAALPSLDEPVEDYLLAELLALEDLEEDPPPPDDAEQAAAAAAAGPTEPPPAPDPEFVIPMEIEDPSGLIPIESVPPPPPEPEPAPAAPAPRSRTRIHHPEEQEPPPSEVGSALTAVAIPARLNWADRVLPGRAVQFGKDQLRVELAGLLPDTFTRVRVTLSSGDRKLGEVSLWANVTRVRPGEGGGYGVVTLGLAVQNGRGEIRKYRELVRRATTRDDPASP